MGRRINFSQEQIDNIVQLFKNNTPIKTIARKMGVTYKPIQRVLEEQGLYTRKNYNASDIKRTYYKNLTEEQKQIIIDNYVLKKLSLTKSGAEFNCSQDTVEKVLKEAGVKKRTYAEAKDIARKYNYNDNYFKNQNENMAYILGFLAADGYIAAKENLIKMELLSDDEEILEKIKEEVSSDRPLQKHLRKKTGHYTTSILVNSRTWKQDLEKYGIHNKKTFTLQPPIFLNPKYYIDYIRGYFDGDGNFYFNRSSYSNVWSIVGTSKIVIQWIQEVLINQYGVRTAFNTKKDLQGNNIYSVEIYNRPMLNRIYNELYSTNSTLFLKRKKEKFDTYIKFFHETLILRSEE